VAAATAGLLLLAGCKTPFTGSSAAGPTGSGTVTVAATPGVADAPLYIALKDNLFQQVGLTVKVVSAASARDAVAALRSGQADIAFGDYADMFYASQANRSLGMSIVANGYDAAPNVMEVLTLPRTGITTPAGLEHRTVGTALPQEMPSSSTAPFSMDTVATWSVLSSDSVHPTRINWKTMDSNNLVNALGNGQVAAILATEPTIYEAESKLGAVPVLDSCTGATANLPLAGYFTDAAYAKKSATNLAAFKAALLRAQADASATTPVQTALTTYDHLTGQTASLVTLGTYPTSLQPQDLQRVANLMFNFSAVPSGAGQLSVPSLIHQ
jgi:NitT/TauT family transport system substrate-binding protein